MGPALLLSPSRGFSAIDDISSYPNGIYIQCTVGSQVTTKAWTVEVKFYSTKLASIGQLAVARSCCAGSGDRCSPAAPAPPQ